MTDQHLSEHFMRSEFSCRCGCGADTVDALLITRLEALRHALGGRMVRVLSGHRCPDHNAAVGGSPESQHLLGKAADITVDGVSPVEVQKAAEALFQDGGLGRYASFTHLDVRPYRARW